MPNKYIHVTPEQRFWRQVDPCRTDGCAVWVGYVLPDGYAQFNFEGKTHKAHHFLVGLPSSGLEWDHLCRVRHCVWPEHLELVTRSENIRRGVAWHHFRDAQLAKTHCPHGHEYSPENTLRHRKANGSYSRDCRTCKRASDARFKERKRMAAFRLAV